jgi:hypothetical protein
VGPKGSGKTAICWRIRTDPQYDAFPIALSLKNFPINLLYEFSQRDFAIRSQFVSLWTFLIFHSLCYSLSQNINVQAAQTKQFRDSIGLPISAALTGIASRPGTVGANASLLGTGVGFTLNRQAMPAVEDIAGRIKSMRDFVFANIDKSKYYIMFDELDEDYSATRTTPRDSQYFSLLSGLMEACISVRAELQQVGANVYPIAFLRDDIYDQIVDQDAGKWFARKIELRWSPANLELLLAHRIGLHSGERFDPRNIDLAVESGSMISKLRRTTKRATSQVGLFTYMVELTRNRPRELLMFMRYAALHSLTRREEKISQKSVRDAEIEYTQWLLIELRGEISSFSLII